MAFGKTTGRSDRSGYDMEPFRGKGNMARCYRFPPSHPEYGATVQRRRFISGSVTGLGWALASGCGGGAPAATLPPDTPTPTPTPTPEPSPPQGAEVVRLSLASGEPLAGVPFTFAQALRAGDLPAGYTLGEDELQCVVRSRWPDGSARIVVLSGYCPGQTGLERTLALQRKPMTATAPSVTLADLRQTGAVVSIEFGTLVARWQGDDWSTPSRVLIEGPWMSAWRFRQPLGSDPHLVAWMEVRCYRGGDVEVLPWLENGYLLRASPGERSATARFTLGSQVRFEQALRIANHQRVVLCGPTRYSHWLGVHRDVRPRHDAEYLMATRLVPRYRIPSAVSARLLSRMPEQYVPLGPAGFPTGMGAAGYHPSIGLLPEWDVAYLVSKAHARTYDAVVIHGLCAGRYGTHFRDESTQAPALPSAYPALVLHGASAGLTSAGASSRNQYTPAATGSVPPAFATSHHPSIGYMAYLLTGWHYHAEEVQFVALANHFKQTDTTRDGARGLLLSQAGANTTRGAAWAMRTLAQAAAVTPPDDPLHAELTAVIDANVDHHHERYARANHNALGLVQPYSNYNGTQDPWTSASWMDDFFTAAWGYLKDLQVCSPGHTPALDAFLAWKYRSVVGRLGGGGTASFGYPWAAQYTLPYAPSARADWSGAGPWYAHWGEVARAMQLPSEVASGAPLDSGYPTSATGYWGNLLPALAYAVDHGADGAAAAWQRVQSAANFAQQAVAYADDPVWGVMPR